MAGITITDELADFVKESMKGIIEITFNTFKGAFYVYISTYEAIEAEQVRRLLNLANLSKLHFEAIRAIEDKLEFVFVKPL